MVVFVFFLILARTTMDPLFPSAIRSVDILLPIVVYLGQRRTLPEGLILALFTSHLFSLCSAAPIGVFTTHYLILFIIARLLSYVTYVSSWYTVFGLMFALSLLSRFMLSLIANFFGHSWGVFHDGFGLVWQLGLNALAAYCIYFLMGLVDKLTFKAPRASIELSEGEL